MVKYFYITFIGIKKEFFDPKTLMGSAGPKEESWKESEDDDDEPMTAFKIPVPEYYSMTLISDNGMFVPAAVEDYIKTSYKVDQVCIQFVKEISEEEYTSQTEYLSVKADEKLKTKIAVDTVKSVIDDDAKLELDTLLEMASKGTLNVYPVDTDCEKEEDEWGDLFKPLDEDD